MSNQAKSILLVDDEPGLRQLLLTTLAAPELHISQVGSGEQALQMARQRQPDLIILDVHLTPEHPNGLVDCRLLKRDPLTARSFIMILTAASRPSDRLAAEAAGADFFVTKPFSPLALLNHIHTALLG
jgi:CheY-like chemotaxis protein